MLDTLLLILLFKVHFLIAVTLEGKKKPNPVKHYMISAFLLWFSFETFLSTPCLGY